MKTEVCTDRFVAWALEPNGVYCFKLLRGEETFVYRCRPEGRRKCLEDLARDGSNPEISLDYYDVVAIADRIREVIPASEFDLSEIDTVVECDPEDDPATVPQERMTRAEFDEMFSDRDATGSVAMLGGMLLFGLAFWGVFIWLAIRAIRGL